MSVTVTNSSFQNYNPPDDHTGQTEDVNFLKYAKHEQHLLNKFDLDGHTLEFHPQTQKLNVEATCTA